MKSFAAVAMTATLSHALLDFDALPNIDLN